MSQNKRNGRTYRQVSNRGCISPNKPIIISQETLLIQDLYPTNYLPKVTSHCQRTMNIIEPNTEIHVLLQEARNLFNTNSK